MTADWGVSHGCRAVTRAPRCDDGFRQVLTRSFIVFPKATLHAFKGHACRLNLIGTAGTESNNATSLGKNISGGICTLRHQASARSHHDERTAEALGPKSIAFAAMAAKITTFRNLVLAHR